MKIHCVLLSHELLTTKFILHINLHTLFIIYCKTKFKYPKIINIQQIHQEIHAKQFLFILFKLFSIGDSFKFEATQETRLI